VSNDLPSRDLSQTWARHCLDCGQVDDSEVWATKAAAEEAGVDEQPWTCPNCGSSRFVVEAIAHLGGG
jgi:transposase-like protein